MKARRRPPDNCGVCGAEIPPNARACPSCGADERTGWDAEDQPDDPGLLDADDTAEAHRAFLRENEGHVIEGGNRWLWWLVAVVLILILGLGALRL